MIQGYKNQLDKAVFALILHTLQETDSEENPNNQIEISERKNSDLEYSDPITERDSNLLS